MAQLFETELVAGARIKAIEADLSKQADVAKVVHFCTAESQCWAGIFHCSGFSTQENLSEIQMGDLERVAGPETNAACWLHEGTLGLQPPLETFAVVSTTSADMCARHMMVYAATNAMLNSFVRYRRST